MKKLPNPFSFPFEYNNHRYQIRDEITQGLMFLWFYGVCSSKEIKNLFIFYEEGTICFANHWVTLHKRLQKIEKYGLQEPNFLGECLLHLVEDCHKNKVLIDNNEQFYTYVRIWILQRFPALEARLHVIFEKINLFF